MGCTNSRKSEPPMKKHMALNGSPVTILSAIADWPKIYVADQEDGKGPAECPEVLEQLKDTCKDAFKRLDDCVIEMCKEPSLSSSNFDKEYRKFIRIQQGLFKELQAFDNSQQWYPVDEILAGEINSGETKILRSGFVKSSFLTSKGDTYVVEYREAAPVIDVKRPVHKKIVRYSTKGNQNARYEKANPKLKEGQQQAAKIEFGVPRSRLLYFDPHCSQGPDAMQSKEGGVQPFPDPATVFGPKYGEYKDVTVTVGHDKFDMDSRGPVESCCFGTRRMHYRYVFRNHKNDCDPKTLYLYRDV